MKALKKYIRIMKIYAKNSLRNRSNFIMSSFAMISRCGLILLLYYYAYNLNNGVINNSTFKESAWSMFLYFVFMVFSLRKVFKNIETDVLSGSVEVYINKPIDYLKYNFIKKIGEEIIPFVIISIVGIIFMISILGLPTNFTFFNLISIIITFILGSILALLFYSIFGLLAFYIQKVNSLYQMTDKIIMVLGGSYLPISLFPNIMKKIAMYSPFGAINFVTSTVYESWRNEYIIKIGMQIFWIFIFYFLLKELYKRAKRRLSINGG